VQNDATRTIQRYNGLLAGDPRLTEFFTVSPLSNLKEIGIKGEAFSGRMSYALNYWEMTRQGSVVNILANGTSQGSPVTFGTQTEIQGAKSKGFEFSAYGSITNRLSLIANYTKMTTSQAFTGQQNSVGYSVAAGTTTIPIRFAPTWNGNVFMKYSFRDTKNEGFEVKAGLSAIGPFLAQITNFGLTKIPQNQKSVDLGASYRWQKYDFDLMVTNVTNAPFLVTRDQPPRTVRLSVATRF
jgi:outer membrane receptor protein involved in Fe transport